MSSTSENYDVVIIGAGHNGLTCTGYLARAGLKVKVLERRDIVGGAAVTEEFYPGFRNSICSYVVSMLSPHVIEELELEKYGMELIERADGMIAVTKEGDYIVAGSENDAYEIGRFSKKDAAAFEKFEADMTEMALIFREIAENRPPNMGGGIMELWNAAKIGNKLRKYSTEQQQKLIEIMTCSLGDYLDNRFETDILKGLYAGDGSTGNFVHPYSTGSALNLLHHEFGNIKGKLGKWWHSKGGMGGITQAMRASAEAYGAVIETDAPVKKLLVEGDPKNGGKAVGVVLEDGREIRAARIAANCTAHILFTKLMDVETLPESFGTRVKNFRYGSGSLRMNVALSELPQITALQGNPHALEEMKRSILICPSLRYLEQAYNDARMTGYAKRPFVSMNIPTLMDDTLAPEGKHIASLFCQHFNPRLPDGGDWSAFKDEAAQAVIDTVTEIAPNFKQSILGMQVLTPQDLEREFSLTGGDIFHGAIHLDQIYSMRPAAHYADYRTPVKNLYMCGAGTHPGGGVSGIPGRLAAQEILKDAKKRRAA